jgi:hypothetical protein
MIASVVPNGHVSNLSMKLVQSNRTKMQLYSQNRAKMRA